MEVYTTKTNCVDMKKMNSMKCRNYKDTKNQDVRKKYIVNDTDCTIAEVIKCWRITNIRRLQIGEFLNKIMSEIIDCCDADNRRLRCLSEKLQ